jgi:deazaflavin-dependent oxidoreductase (nitroreductase family)
MAATAGSASEEEGAPLPEGHRRNPLTSTPMGGRVLSAWQLPWFTVLPPRGFGVLTTIGRKSGKKRRHCVRVVRVGDTAYLAAIRGPVAGWVRNVRADPTVWLRIHGGTFRGTARGLRPGERDAAEMAYCEALHRLDRIAYVLHMAGWPTRQRMRALHRHWFTTGTPLAIDIAPDRSAGQNDDAGRE